MVVSKETERQLITEHFATAWAAAYPSIPVAWPNHEFTTPANSMFAVFSLVDRGTTRESLGRTYLKRHRGTLQIDLYSPAGTGVRPATQISDFLENLYDSLDLVTTDGEQVFFRTPTSRTVSINEDRASNLADNWQRIIVECPYDRQQVVYR